MVTHHLSGVVIGEIMEHSQIVAKLMSDNL
jgi:hypothetical protein